MKKLAVSLAALLVLAFAAPAAFAELELGMSWTPITDTTAPTDNATVSVPGFHVGYGWFVLYASWDALAMPAFWVETAAAYTKDGIQYPGPSVPAFLNLYDVGFRFLFKPVEVYALIGTNTMKIYEDSHFYGLGANIRLGAGCKFNWWGLSLSGTNVYGSWSDLAAVVSGLASDKKRDWAEAQIVDGIVPSLNLTFYF